MRMRVLTVVAVAGAISVAGCTVSQTDVPMLTGPSTSATSVTVTANPDLIMMGQSSSSMGQSSVILIRVLDEAGQPKKSQAVRLDTFVGEVKEDCGQLQSRTLTTDSNGQATTLFTAPGTPAPMPGCTGFVPGSPGADTVDVRVTPVGTDARANTGSSTSIRMIPVNFLTPVGGLVVNFTISPNAKPSPAVVTFSDAGSSSPGHTIVSYFWDFSDGSTKVGSVVTHDFAAAGTYSATLTITDDIGQVGFKTANFEVKP